MKSDHSTVLNSENDHDCDDDLKTSVNEIAIGWMNDDNDDWIV